PAQSTILHHSHLCCRISFTIPWRLAQDGTHVVVSIWKQQNVDWVVAVLQGERLNVTGTVCHMGRAEKREWLLSMLRGQGWGAAVNPLVGSTLGAGKLVGDKVWPGKYHHSQPHLLFLCRVEWPEDCAELVSFLCSSDASYITGKNIMVPNFSPTSEGYELRAQACLLM
uniref:Uncharacterized protein n=1 Tax=Monodon monoceros TaxID=40151 RepID=A0A8C6BGR0_MONMO